jgi:hypothetical protein
MRKKYYKCKELFGLNKIPDEELLRLSRIEVGKLKSYIQELEDSIRDKLIKEDISSIINDEMIEKLLPRVESSYIDNLKNNIKGLKDKIIRLENNISNLKLNKYKNERKILYRDKIIRELTEKLNKYENIQLQDL